MAMGGGKYEEVTHLARTRTGGGVVLIVFDGFLGNGFSVQATLPQILALPKTLRDVADQIERDHAALPGGSGNPRA